MSVMVSQITSLMIGYSTVCSGADEIKHQRSTPLAFVRGIHQWPVNYPHKGPVTRKMFPFDDFIISPELSLQGFSSQRTYNVARVSMSCGAMWAHRSGPWFNIKISSYQYRKSHCGDKTVVRSSYLHNGISYTGKMSSLYWIGALDHGPWQLSASVTQMAGLSLILNSLMLNLLE